MKKPDILNLTGASLPTLNRWMRQHPKLKQPDENSLAGHPFPKPASKEGKTLVWDDDIVRDWWAANEKLVGRHTQESATISLSSERFGSVIFQLTRPHDQENETVHQAQRRLDDYDKIKSTVREDNHVRLIFDSVDDAIHFKLKYT